MTEPSHAVFLSYASQDAEAAQRICEALRAAGIEVWFDQSELRGGDAWDQSIRKQIKTCALFLPVISRNTHDRDEGYFRLEWKLAVDRCHLMAADRAFLFPVVIDDTRDDDERVPERFREVQWTRLPGGVTSAAFVERVRRLLTGEPAQEPTRTASAAARMSAVPTTRKPVLASWRSKAALLATIAGKPDSSLQRLKVALLVIIAVTTVAIGYFALGRFVNTIPKGLVPPPTTAGSDWAFTREQNELLDHLGIDPMRADQSEGEGERFQHLIQSAPRHVRLGSTLSEIQTAFALCETYARECSIDWYADEQVRETTLTPFEMDATPVSVAEFRKFVEATAYRTRAELQRSAYQFTANGLLSRRDGSWRNAVTFDRAQDQWPVVAVDFTDARAYCEWKKRRLPTEDEWEYVARGPDRHVFPWGNAAPRVRLRTQGPPPAIGGQPAEGIGGRYRDLSGVVWEWVDTDHVAVNSTGHAVGGKVLKGGSWREVNPANNRAAARRYAAPELPDDVSGFRCAKSASTWPDADIWLPLS